MYKVSLWLISNMIALLFALWDTAHQPDCFNLARSLSVNFITYNSVV